MKTNFKIFSLIGIMVLSMNFAGCDKDDESSNSFTDSRDRNTYKIVTIGEQTWMAENMAFEPASGDFWNANGSGGNTGAYGYLYSWETAQTIAPAGWHIPTKAEWEELSNYLGTNADGGGKLKEEGTVHWLTPNTGATNASGFSALPGGGRFFDNNPFKYFGEYAYFWTATESVTNFATYYYLYSGDEYLHTSSNAMQFGFSVRCIKN